MKKLLFILPILFILAIAACSKRIPNPDRNEVTWRFVVYDSNYRVVDSTPEMHYPDSALVTMLGPSVVKIPSPIDPHDSVDWANIASFFMLIGPSTVLPGIANIPVPAGGCAFASNFLYPTLDRTGWMLQRTENGKRINMFSEVRDGYIGTYSGFPYTMYINGIPYPAFDETDYINESWICGSTQGSCQMAPPFGPTGY
jgi:hypothetical protein